MSLLSHLKSFLRNCVVAFRAWVQRIVAWADRPEQRDMKNKAIAFGRAVRERAID
jgi:hypothetical protein